MALLSEADQFHYHLQDLCDDLADRLEIWEFRNHFDELCGSLRADIETIISAVDELVNPSAFHDVLAVILALGNFLNRKRAQGIRIESLSKLADLKTTSTGDGGPVENLLEYLVYYISQQEDRSETLLSFGEQLLSVQAASRVDPPKLNRDLAQLTQGMKKIEKLKLIKYGKEDRFQEVINNFFVESKCAMECIRERYEVMIQEIKSLAELYGEEEDKLIEKYSSFFLEITNFVNAFNKARANIIIKSKREKRTLDLDFIKASARVGEKDGKTNLT